MTDNASSTRLMRLPEVLRNVPVSRSTWLTQVRKGIAPAPVRLGPRTVAWRASDVESFISKLQAA